MLPDPEILKKPANESLEIPVNTNLDGATSPTPQWLPSDGQPARSPVTVFQDKKVLLSNDLKLTNRLQDTIKAIIHNGGGKVVTEVEDCDTLICTYREGLSLIHI